MKEKNISKNITQGEIERFKLKIKQELMQLSDLKYQKFHSNLCPGINNILGVRVPVLRKYAKNFKKDFPTFSYYDIDDEFYEEIMLQGMLMGLKANGNFMANIKEIEWFVPKINNWAICDIYVSGLKFISKDLNAYWEFIKEYAQKESEFEKRFAYVVMLSYYLKDEYIDDVLKILTNENSQDYYVYMAVAWALSVALVKYYDKTLKVMQNSELNSITYNKAIQKACESYRITQEQKEELRKLRRGYSKI